VALNTTLNMIGQFREQLPSMMPIHY